MKKKLIIMGLAMLGYLGIAHAQTLITNGSAVTVWTDTGIHLTNNEWVSLNAAIPWRWQAGANGLNDPDGVEANDISDEWLNLGVNNHASLIAFVGANPFAGSFWDPTNTFQTNQYLEVGTARQFMSSTNGDLWLGINDDAFTGATGDNSGSNYVAITLGFCNDYTFTNPMLSVASVSSNAFSFYISNGIPNSICAVFDSADLTHWTLVDTLKLSANGSSVGTTTDYAPPSTTSGLISGAFVNITQVPYRFYKICDGPIWSQPIGFERITVGPGTTNNPGVNSLIADQLIAPTNTFDKLFKPMIDGSSLPNGSIITKFDLTTHAFDIYYTYSGGSWSPNGNATLLPGEAACLIVTNTVTVTFAGLVPEGSLTNYTIINGNNGISSMVPQAGGIHSPLGFDPQDGDTIFLWTGSGWHGSTFLGTNGTGFTYPNVWYDNVNITNEPIINVGESFLIQNEQSTNEYWIRKFPGCCDE